MRSEQYQTAVKNLIEKGFNQKDLSSFEAYFSPSLKDHALPPGMPEGLEGRTLFYAAFLSAFSDLQVQVEDVFSEDDKVVTRWSAQGTHDGELMGIPPTGRKVSTTGTAIDRFENGQSAEHWEVFDQVGLMQQLGVIPS